MILKNNIITGVEGSFMFGNNIKNEDILSNITTNEGFLINSSGELNQVIFYQRGFNSHILFGKKLKKDPNKLTGLYIYGGLGYIDHKIRIEADRSHLPQINDDYIYSYRDGSNFKLKGSPRNTAGWNSVETTGHIIEKIGPILATKYSEVN